MNRCYDPLGAMLGLRYISFAFTTAKFLPDESNVHSIEANGRMSVHAGSRRTAFAVCLNLLLPLAK